MRKNSAVTSSDGWVSNPLRESVGADVKGLDLETVLFTFNSCMTGRYSEGL